MASITEIARAAWRRAYAQPEHRGMLRDGQDALNRLWVVLAYEGTPADIAAHLLAEQAGLHGIVDILDDLTSDLWLVERAVRLIAYASDDDPSLGGERLAPNRVEDWTGMRVIAAALRRLADAVEISPNIEEAAKDFPGEVSFDAEIGTGIARELVALAAAVQREAATIAPHTGNAA